MWHFLVWFKNHKKTSFSLFYYCVFVLLIWCWPIRNVLSVMPQNFWSKYMIAKELTVIIMINIKYYNRLCLRIIKTGICLTNCGKNTYAHHSSFFNKQGKWHNLNRKHFSKYFKEEAQMLFVAAQVLRSLHEGGSEELIIRKVLYW